MAFRLLLKSAWDEITDEGLNVNKFIIAGAGFFILAIVLAGFSFSKQQDTFTPTNEHGRPFVDVNGELVTVTLPDENFIRTEVNGKPVTNAFGGTYTEPVHEGEYIDVAVTESDGELVTDENGQVETTKIRIYWQYDPRA